jgi:excisionase family DNA binding protein
MRREENPVLLCPTEAAELAGLSTRAIYRAIQRGELRAVRLSSRLRIQPENFDEWIARSEVRVERPPTIGTRLVTATVTRGSFRRLVGDEGRAAS